MSPYLLFGFFLAGLISLFLTPSTVQKHLGSAGWWSVIKAALFGVPLPLCSCSVIPIAASLRKHGASRGATISFLISTPQTGVDSILVTLSMLGPLFAILRPLAAFVSGILGGVAVNWLDPENEQPGSPMSSNSDPSFPKTLFQKLKAALSYGFFGLSQDLAKPMLTGLIIAALLAVVVPDNFFSQISGIPGMLLMIAVSIPLYVCATGAVPIAAALLLKGISPGAIFVFLMTGPATNAATISIIWKLFGKKVAFIYIGTMVLCGLCFGMLLEMLWIPGSLTMSAICPLHIPDWAKTSSAIVLLGMLLYGYFKTYQLRPKPVAIPENSQLILLSILEMKCQKCVRSITDALLRCPGVQTVAVDLAKEEAQIIGHELDAQKLIEKVSQLGFPAKEKRNS